MVSPIRWAVSKIYGSETDPPVVAEVERASYAEQIVSRLRHFENQVLPPSARVDPTLSQRVAPPFRLSNLLVWGVAIAKKSTELAGEVFVHQVWGPRKPSWGIEMTVITTIMRGAGKYSEIASLGMLRGILNVLGYVPIPSNAMVTPVTFRVPKRKLRGFLAECSSAEDGTRELAGEWVVGRHLWRRLQAEWRASRGEIRKNSVASIKSHSMDHKDRVILYIHGGAYFMFSAATHRIMTIQLSKHLNARLFAIDYRLAPETRFPGQLIDVVSAYMRLLEDLHIPPENIIVAGDSAGGALTLALLLYLRDNKYPLPSGAIVMSPWADLTMSCDSWDSNEAYDIIPRPTPGDHLHPILCYLGDEGIEKYLTHPYVSPLFGDFTGIPPLLIQCGDSEVLRDEITLLAHKATRAGVKVRHEIYEDCVHVFQTFPFLEASRRAFLSCRDFVKRVLPAQQRRSPQSLDDVAIAGLEAEMDNEKTRTVAADGQEEVSQNKDLPSLVDDDPAEDEDEDDNVSIASSSSATLHDDTGERSPIPKHPAGTERYLSRLSLRTTHLTSPSTPTTPTSTTTFIPRNHYRRASGTGFTPLSATALTMSPCLAPAPKPIVRTRATSHPDIHSLCADWAERGPANETTLYSPHAVSNSRGNV
ncbi:lipase/ esterase [Schizopora paradoxa]|uniref:Lipase/ esterase n=1 Tax=Schizopora paradoxa TaxID=27342 RepID=A0A0H2SSI4_9AGAM|nr:lipase/ esterase [Schizopora paradoxa]